MSDRVIVVGPPERGGLAACTALADVATLAWSDAAALKGATEPLGELGSDALLVNPDHLAESTAAMSLRSQIFGYAPLVVAVAHETNDLPEVVRTTHIVLRHLPPLPVVVTGPVAALLATALTAAIDGLNLASPVACSLDRLAVEVRQATDNRPPPSPVPAAGSGCC